MPSRNEDRRAACRVTLSRDPLLDAPRNIQELKRQTDMQSTTWRIQRIGWWGFLLFSLAGAVGLLGQGPLAEVTGRTGEAQVRYDWMLRREGDSVVTFDIPGRNGRAVITLPARYMEATEISAIQPQPWATFTGPDRQFFVFSAPYGRTTVRLTIRARRIGLLDFAPSVNGQPLDTRRPVVLP